jgi:hypothetical protein
MLSIDVGWSTIKVAAISPSSTTPQMLHFGVEAGNNIPLQAYIPKSGPIRVGLEALEFIHADPAGSIGEVGSLLWRTGYVFRNGRRISIRDIGAAFFSHIKYRLSKDYQLTQCLLTSTLNPFVTEDRNLIAAARLGGLADVFWKPTALCIFHLAQQQQSFADGVYAILDMGAGSTNLEFVEKRGSRASLIPDWPPRYSPGVRIYEELVYDHIRRQITSLSHDASDFHKLREQIKYVISTLQDNALEDSFFEFRLGNDVVTLPSRDLLNCKRRCLNETLDTLSKNSQEPKSYFAAPIHMIVSGGGSKIPGVVESIRAEGWEVPIQFLENPEHASALGLSLNAPPLKLRSDKFAGVSTGTLAPPVNITTLPLPKLKQIQCSDPNCGMLNDPQRLYCFRCGNLLQDDLAE